MIKKFNFRRCVGGRGASTVVSRVAITATTLTRTTGTVLSVSGAPGQNNPFPLYAFPLCFFLTAGGGTEFLALVKLSAKHSKR
jgi:hypothetical protein